jgi:hypothetical protein
MKPRLKHLLFCFLLILTFCKQDEYSYYNNPAISDNHGVPIDSLTWYFPANSITQRPPFAKENGTVDTFWHQTFSKYLFYLEEPILSNYFLGETIIRLTWLRAFDPIVVLRLTDNNGKNYLYENGYIQQKDSFKTSYGFYKETCKLINKKRCIQINHNLFEKIDSIINSNNFYQLPSTDFIATGLDGSEWILEVHKQDKYHLIWKWSPDSSNLIRKVGDRLINLSDFRNVERY